MRLLSSLSRKRSQAQLLLSLSLLLPVASLAALAVTSTANAQRNANAAGEITIPLTEVEALHAVIARMAERKENAPGLEFISRSFVGKFKQGQLEGTLTQRIRTYENERRTIALLTHAVAISSATVDGKSAMPLPMPGGGIGLAIKGAGLHTLTLRFSTGQKSERFQRRLNLPLPAHSQTQLTLEIDEVDIDVNLSGVILSQRTSPKGGVGSSTRASTRIVAALLAQANPSVTWRRQLTHAEREAPELEAVVHTLVTPRVDLIRTQSTLTFRVLRGEADRLRIAVPPGVEVTHVTGPAVLQWVTERADAKGRTLVVLFRHLISDHVAIHIETQAPVDDEKKVEVKPLAPLTATVRSGVIAIAGRAGFELETKIEGGRAITPNALPAAVIEMTQDPLLAGFRYEKKTPRLVLAMKQNETLSLTQALVDDLEAATVVTETGAVITKVRLTVRNTTQQHLRMRVPKGAEVTHALIDGVPFTPGDDGKNASGGADLLIPLRQSEKVAQRRHFVDVGETLGSISLRYYNRTGNWRDILTANGIAHPSDIRTGQVLLIPTVEDSGAFTESTFTLEIAYRIPPEKIDLVGTRDLVLPVLDLPVMRVAWHVYLPSSIEPLRFEGNLNQLDGVRYDPLRRARQFFESALRIRSAWAGGYENILKARKRIYKTESRRSNHEAMSDFPLAGQRTRFRRVLLRDDTAHLRVTYIQKSLLPFVQGTAFLLMALLVFAFVRRLRTAHLKRMAATPEGIALVVGTLGLLYVATMVLGTHRAMLLGVNAALLVSLVPVVVARIRGRTARLFTTSWEWERFLRVGTLAKLAALCIAIIMVLQVPLFLSTFVVVVLVTMTWRYEREVTHA